MSIVNIGSIEVRNLLRGIQNKEADRDTRRTLNHLRKVLSIRDAANVSNLLNDSMLFSQLGMPE